MAIAGAAVNGLVPPVNGVDDKFRPGRYSPLQLSALMCSSCNMLRSQVNIFQQLLACNATEEPCVDWRCKTFLSKLDKAAEMVQKLIKRPEGDAASKWQEYRAQLAKITERL